MCLGLKIIKANFPDYGQPTNINVKFANYLSKYLIPNKALAGYKMKHKLLFHMIF